MEMQSPPPCPPTVTIRRNPHRKARATPSSAIPLRELVSSPAPPRDITSCPLRDILSDESLEIPENTDNHDNRRSPETLFEILKVYLRIRPMDIQRHGVQPKSMTESKNAWPKNPKVKINSRPTLKKSTEICVKVNDDLHSVTVLTPQALQETKRIKSEAYEGFSHVFSSEASQTDVYEKMMNPLVEDFLNGKSGLLAAMGPSGSGKTHTVFGCTREPGMVPLALRQIFSKNESNGTQSSRIFRLSMFEICSEKGKAERMVDLLHDGGEICMQQSIIRGLQEVVVCDAQQAEFLIAQGMLKRSTAMTCSNSQSSRSQCIINIQCGSNKSNEDIEGKSSTTMLSIVDLAGAEKEKKTGNQGARLLESNFINNTSMVFGLCLRSLLEHQKNRIKPLQKHFQYSLLTRYLREYLEGKKRMMLILTVKPGVENYLDTSFLLRQASPFTKIKFKSLVEPVTCSKRPNQAFPRAEQLKKMKINSGEAYLVDKRIDDRNVPLNISAVKVVKDGLNQKSEGIGDESLTEIEVLDYGFVSKEVSGKSSSEKDCVIHKNDKDKKYQILQGFSKALWNVLKNYKEKLEWVEIESCHLRDSLTKEQTRNLDLQNELAHERMRLSHLENELKQLKSHCMCQRQDCTDHEFPVSLNYACSNPSKYETASSQEVRDSSVTFASSGEVEEQCHQQLEVLSKSINDVEDAMGLKDTSTVDMHSRYPPVSTDAEDGFKDIGTLDVYSTSETHYTSHAQDATGYKDKSTADMYAEPKDFSVSAVDVEDGMINTGTSDICCTSETTSQLEIACLYSSHKCEQAAENFVGDAKNSKPESECVLNASCPDTSLECESKSTQDYENLRYANRDQTQLEIGETDSSVTFASSGEVEEQCHQQLEVLSKSINDTEDALGFKDASTVDMHSRYPLVSTDDAEDGFKDIGTLDEYSTSEIHYTSHAQDATGFKETSTEDMYAEPKDFSVTVVDVEDGMIDTDTSDVCCTSETTSLLENVCLYSSHKCEQAEENFVGDAKYSKPESECVLNASCPDTSLECESKSTPQDYENLRYANRDQTQLESWETALSKVESPKNDESCFLAEEAQFNNEKSKLNPITVLPKEGLDGRNKPKTVSGFASCSNFQHSGKPKRRLLPASSVLLKDISRLEVNDEEDKPKGARGAKRAPMDDKNRTQGSISLLHLLTTNLDR